MATPAIIKNEHLPVVVIVGRANVGKSTLFNTLIEEKKALVSTVPGTTRTNNEGDVLWRGTHFHVVDTGGQDTEENELFAKEIYEQAEKAIKSADVIILLTDAKTGLLPQERELARRLQKQAQKQKSELILVANKADNGKVRASLDDPDWLKLGMGKPMAVSASNGAGVGDLLDVLHEKFADRTNVVHLKDELDRHDNIRVSLVGKPNVGKSSLFNKLIGQDKVIVSDVAHTTREPFDTTITYTTDEDTTHTITFVDTAGMRKKSKVGGYLERAGISKTIQSIEDSDIVLLVIDGSIPIASQDLQLGGLIEKRSKSVIIVLNKWDLAEDHSDTKRNEIMAHVRASFPHLDFAPIIFTSGKTGYRTHDIFPLIIRVMNARKTEIPDPVLALFIKDIQRIHRPSRGKGTRHPEIMGLRQLRNNPPMFEIHIKYRTSIHRSYIHFIENKLRERFDFTGAPLVIKMTKLKK